MANLENIMQQVPSLTREEKITLRSMLDLELHAPQASNRGGHASELLGLFSDEPDVLDRVMDAVYEQRARPLRG